MVIPNKAKPLINILLNVISINNPVNHPHIKYKNGSKIINRISNNIAKSSHQLFPFFLSIISANTSSNLIG